MLQYYMIVYIIYYTSIYYNSIRSPARRLPVVRPEEQHELHEEGDVYNILRRL